jgi:hypothetical protein
MMQDEDDYPFMTTDEQKIHDEAIEKAAALCDQMAGEMLADGQQMHFVARTIRELKFSR